MIVRLLPEVCTIQYGYPFDSTKFSNSEGRPLIRIRDLKKGYTETFTTENCDDNYIVHDGDILIGMDGEFNIEKWKGGPALLNQRVCRLLPHDGIDPNYLFYFLPKALKQIEHETPFVTVKHLKAKQLNAIKIPVPSLVIQNQITAVLDRLAILITLRNQQLEYLDELVKSRFVELFGDLLSKPKYSGIKLGTLGDMVTGGTPSRRQADYYGGSIPFISTPCLGPDYISAENTKNFLTEEGVKNSSTHKIPAFSLMIGNRVGVGKTSINTCEMCTNQDILSFVNIDKSKFNLLFLKKTIEQYSSYYEFQKRGATIKGIPSELVKNTLIPDVPITLQRQFSYFVQQLDKSKLAVQKSLEELETLKKSLMQQYFG